MTRTRLLALAGLTLAAGGAAAAALAPDGDERPRPEVDTRPPAGRSVAGPPRSRALAAGHPVSAATAPLTVRRAYAGVACRTPNRIACDRIGVAVWLRRDAFTRVTATVGERPIALHRGRDGLWSGYLAKAGLRDGPLRVPARDGRWIGFDPPTVRAVLDATRSDGSRATTVVATPLRAGWG